MDPIADMLTQVRNAAQRGHASVSVPYSQIKLSILKKFEEKGFVAEVNRKGRSARKRIECKLIYQDGKPALTDVRRKSRPGNRAYMGVREIKPFKQGHGTIILSTPRGVLTDTEAKKLRVGGEVLCEVW